VTYDLDLQRALDMCQDKPAAKF